MFHILKNTIQQQLGNEHIVTFTLTDYNNQIRLESGNHVHSMEHKKGIETIVINDENFDLRMFTDKRIIYG